MYRLIIMTHAKIKAIGVTIAIITSRPKYFGVVLLFGIIVGEIVGEATMINPDVCEPVTMSVRLFPSEVDTDEKVFEKEPSATDALSVADMEL